MHIYKNIIRYSLFIISGVALSSSFLYAQSGDATGAYSPYSFYGVGDLKKPGFAYNNAMGGVGYGIRTNRIINYMNPAALNAQDSSSFMFDFGGEFKNYYVSSGSQSTATNIFNIDHFVFGFPVWRKISVAVGVMPYSYVGYDITYRETDPNVIVEASGDVQYTYLGEGGLNQLVLSFASGIGKRFSIGGHAHYIFGAIDRYYNIVFAAPEMHNIKNSTSIKAGNFDFTLGAQYEQAVGDNYQMVLGAVCQLGNNMKVKRVDYSYVSTSLGADTIRYSERNDARLLMPTTLGLGASIRKGVKWQAGLDYTYCNWNNTTFENPSNKQFKAMPSHSLRGGVEYTPNMYDIRYYLRRISYRAGLYYENTYMQFGDTRIRDYGISFGAGIPLGIYNNALNVAAEIGRRGTTNNGLLREFYWKISLSASIYDIWFQKYRYD